MDFNDKPIAYSLVDKRPLYDNAVTVVCTLLYNVGSAPDYLVAIVRNTEPGLGKIALPGGFQMRGETWEECAARELKEELGIEINPALIKFFDLITDEFGHNVVITQVHLPPSQKIIINEDEVQRTELIDYNRFNYYSGKWAFPIHLLAAQKFLRENK